MYCGEGETPQTKITGVWEQGSQCLGHTGFAPIHDVCAFLVYTAQAPGCSAGELSKAGPGLRALPRPKLHGFRFLGTPQGTDSVAPAFCALPRSEQLRRPGAWQARSPSWAVVPLITSLVPVAQSPGCSRSTISSVPCVSSGELISDCDPPGGCQLSRIPGRLG